MKKFLIASVLSFGCMSQGMADEASAPVVVGGMEFVDMGTSVMWAVENLGVDEDYPFGKFYASGAVEPYTGENTGVSWFKDNPIKGSGLRDMFGDPNYDAATAALGSQCTTPNYDQLKELDDACRKVVSLDEETGRYVLTLTSTKTGNSIRMFYAGYILKGVDHTDKDFLCLISSTVAPSWDCYLTKIDAKSSPNLAPWYQWRAAVDGYYYNVRPVYNVPVAATELTLNVSTVSIALGDSYALSSTILPEEASQMPAWSSSDEGIATVSEEGVVTAHGTGECTITASTTDGSGLTAECRVRVVSPPEAGDMSFIDMGTSVMWATKPLGVTESSPYGSLYLFGAPEAYSTPSGLPSSDAELTEWGGDPEYDASTAAYGYNVHTPSKAEFEELMKVCTLEYKYDYSKLRYVVTITSTVTGNVIQATGAGYITFGNNHGSSGDLYFYSSTLKGVEDNDVQGYCFSPKKAVSQGIENAMLLQNYATSNAYQILPVYDPNRDVKVEKIRLNAVTLTLGTGETSQLEATVEPENATNMKVEWSTTDESVATVDADGTVEGVGQGSCEIVATAADGSGVRATCSVSVVAPTPEMEFVDLGLSVLWGKYDLGASTASEKGVYYAWGTVDNANNYLGATAEAYKMQPDGPCTGVLRDPDDPTKPYDVATELLGGEWRTPTKAEWQELVDNTTVARETVEGVASACFTSKINGNSVYMGGFGYMRETSGQPLMSTSVIRQTSDAPNGLIYDTKYVIFPAVNDLARYCYWLVPIRPVCNNPMAAIGNVAVDKKSDGLFDIYDVSGRFVDGRLTYSDARERLPKGVYIFVGSDGRHYKVAF